MQQQFDVAEAGESDGGDEAYVCLKPRQRRKQLKLAACSCAVIALVLVLVVRHSGTCVRDGMHQGCVGRTSAKALSATPPAPVDPALLKACAAITCGATCAYKKGCGWGKTASAAAAAASVAFF